MLADMEAMGFALAAEQLFSAPMAAAAWPRKQA